VWSLIVWWLGEGLGGVLAGSAVPLMGAPGAVILYALLALLLWPAAEETGGSLAETSIFRRVAPLAWVLVWAGEAYFALLPANDSPRALQGMLAGMADGEPHPIASLDGVLARFAAHHSILGPGLGALFALCALAVFLPPRLAKPLYGLAMVMAAITWLGQDFGAILTGQGTDPNSGPLLFLLALAYWPIRPQFAAELVAGSPRRPLLRVGVAAAAAALIAASSVAAASGLTTATATASTSHTRLIARITHMLGPGPLRAHHQFAGYQILFRDSVNRATDPGGLTVELQRRGRPLSDARIAITYHCLDMKMPTHTITLLNRRQGQYSQTSPLLGMGGRWHVIISIQPRRGPELQLSFTDLVAR
jgi:hypothetical protein